MQRFAAVTRGEYDIPAVFCMDIVFGFELLAVLSGAEKVNSPGTNRDTTSEREVVVEGFISGRACWSALSGDVHGY